MTAAEYRAARVAAHLTQQQLANAVGVAPNTIARRERGERPVTPEAAAALLYAIALEAHRAAWRAFMADLPGFVTIGDGPGQKPAEEAARDIIDHAIEHPESPR